MTYAVIALAVVAITTQLQVMALRRRVEDLEFPRKLRREHLAQIHS